MAARTTPQLVSEQILGSVHASLARGDKQLAIRLHPPELGTVLVRFQEHGDHISGLLEVGRSDTRQEIEQALPQVLRGLQEAGVQIRRFEVVTSDQAERDFTKGQLPQDAWPQQHGSGQGREHAPTWSSTSGAQLDRSGLLDLDEPHSGDRQASATPGRLDLLL